MRVLAPAKINLHLRVGAVREDGFHPLMSWMVTVGLFDILTIDEESTKSAPSGAGGLVQLTCSDAALDCGEKNLVVRAVRGLAQGQAGPISHRSLRLHLEKRIPVGGGLGGGSSDAARMLLALAHLWRLDRSAANVAEKLASVALSLGSDVPFFLFGPSSICQGRGEIVQPVAAPRPGWALLILPQDISMPTKLVYQKFDALALGKAQARLDPPWPADRGDRHDASGPTVKIAGQEWTSLTSDALLPRLVNDLEEPAFAIAPQLGRLRSEMEEILGRIVRMSGSGSTLFTLYNDEHEARNAERLVTNRNVRAIAVQIAPPIHDDLENEQIPV